MKSGAHLITKKREKQVSKHGYTYKHDLTHTPAMLINAAHAYMTGEVNFWPFEKESFKLGDRIENLTNAGAMIAAAIDRLQPYEVGKIYKSTMRNQTGEYKVTKIKTLRSGTFVYFTGLSGYLLEDIQSFMIGSEFDHFSEPVL